MIYTATIEGLPLQTGDIICTTDGAEGSVRGAIWRAIGRLVPGDIDHCIVYVGPGFHCVEAGARGVIAYEMPGGVWDALALAATRGQLIDTFYGVAYPLERRGLDTAQQQTIRAGVASFCLEQVALHQPYNPLFFDPHTDDAFYCSQLIYRAYLNYGIDLNSNRDVPTALGTEHIIFPQEIWNACVTRKAG